ncbi:hypothetical protein [Streptomyces fagopyri]|uniref:hypothetical protein n=1 Tax=Streptomyces fagopyri TaxID=2662397 RepID=UPI001D171990|nr:hypothetical protein [Streptomyces fagopyri]
MSYRNFDGEEALIEWECIFTGRSFDEVVAADEPGVAADPDDGEGPMVLAVSEALQDALAAAGQPRLVEVGRLWALERMAEGEVFDQEIATQLLSGLSRLAQGLRERDRRLYCWTA